MNMNAEYICDYLVTAEQKKINQIYLELLQEFERLCKKAGLTYWLTYGGLIGAIRHKGFIPWDDDIDLMMPREDFDRLQAMTQEDFGVREPYFLQNITTEPFCLQSLIRFRRSDTTDIRDYDLFYAKKHPNGPMYNMGINLAIVPLDYLPDVKWKSLLQKKVAYTLRGISYRTNTPDPQNPLQHKICAAIVKFFGVRNYIRLFHKVYQLCSSNKSGMRQIFDGLYISPQRFPAKIFEQTLYLPFEDITVPVPVGYDTFLRSVYGDYMQFPPAEQRHHLHDGHTLPDTPYPEGLKALLDAQ